MRETRERLAHALTPGETQLKKSPRRQGQVPARPRGTVGIDQILTLTRGMKQAENRARKVSIAEDRYALVLLPALLLLLLEGILPEAWYVRRKARAGAVS